MEILIKIGISVEKLLQGRTGTGTGIVDCEAGRGEGISAGKAGDYHPVLTSGIGFGPNQHRLALLQQLVNGGQVSA